MTNRKSTKRALLGSVMAMVLCLAMLVGATFMARHRTMAKIGRAHV